MKTKGQVVTLIRSLVREDDATDQTVKLYLRNMNKHIRKQKSRSLAPQRKAMTPKLNATHLGDFRRNSANRFNIPQVEFLWTNMMLKLYYCNFDATIEEELVKIESRPYTHILVWHGENSEWMTIGNSQGRRCIFASKLKQLPFKGYSWNEMI